MIFKGTRKSARRRPRAEPSTLQRVAARGRISRGWDLQSANEYPFFNFRVQLVRRIPSRKYLPVLDRLAVIYRMPVNFYQHSNVMPRVFTGSIRTAVQLV